MKIFNWIVGSFCRTLGRFLFYIAIGILAMLFISGKVHAISFDPYTWHSWNFNSSHYLSYYANEVYSFDLDLTYTGEINDEITNKYGLLNAWNGSSGSNGTTYNFLISACTAGVNITGFANRYNSFVKKVDSGLSCVTNGFSQEIKYYFVKLTPNVYNVGNSTTYYVNWNSTIEFTNPYTWTVPFRLISVDILTDDEMTSLLNDYTNIDALNNQINEIQETNSKLDEQISQNETIIDQNQDIIDNQEQTNEELGNLNDNLTSTEGADLDALENSAGWLPAGPIDSILNLPLSLLNNLTTNLNKRCQPVILPIPYVNKDLTLPCVNTLYDDMGISGWVTTIGVIASAFIMFSYLLKLYKWVDDTLSFRENNQIDNWGGI